MYRSPLIRIAAALAALSVVFTVAVPAPASAEISIQAIPDFVFNGGGWGHGIGMSQYGARGYALKGWNGIEIAEHYFPTARVGSVTDKDVSVNLDAAANLDPRSSSYNAGYTQTLWQLRPGYVGGSMKANIDGTVYAFGDVTLSFTVVDSLRRMVVTSSDGRSFGPTTAAVRVYPGPGSPRLTQVLGTSGPFSHSSVLYRGELVVSVSASAGRLKLVNRISMEDYLYGVVPRESPASWGDETPAALQAQALVARSYAYNKGEMYCTTASQVYNGWGKGDRVAPERHEDYRTTKAVDDTHGKVLKTTSGDVIETFFHSSSGGHTANIEDVWPGTGYPSAQYPYYSGVESPYEGIAGCPDLQWKPWTVDGLKLGEALNARYPSLCPVGAGQSVWVQGVAVARATSGYATSVTIKWSNGFVTDNIGASSFRSAVLPIVPKVNNVPISFKSTKFYVNSFPISRVQGIDRYATSVEICNAAFPEGAAPAVVLASGQDYADALTGSAVAGAAGGPLLLTAKDRLPASVASEIKSLAPATVYIMGGTAAVSSAVEDSVRSLLPSAEIIRFAGANRYDTSVLAAREVESLTGVTKAIVVSGSAWADGAAISGLAYAKGYPILLTATNSIPGSVRVFFDDAEPATTLIAGGTAVVTEGVATTISDLTGGDVTRLWGADRYYTSSAIARHSVDVEGFGYGQVYLATGATYADALSGGVLAGTTSQPILLTGIDTCPGGTRSFLRERKPGIAELTIFGGPSAVSIDGLLALDEVMR